MSYLPGTNVLSELRQGRRTHPLVREWSDATLDPWQQRLSETFGDRILPIDADVANRWGQLNVPDSVPTIDGLLAATAMMNGLTLVIRNVKDVSSTGVSFLDPFQEQTRADSTP